MKTIIKGKFKCEVCDNGWKLRENGGQKTEN